MPQHFLQVQGLAKRFGKQKEDKAFTVFENVNFNIEKGEFVCIIGHSGCGKSTIMNILAGLDSPTDGPERCRQPQTRAAFRRHAPAGVDCPRFCHSTQTAVARRTLRRTGRVDTRRNSGRTGPVMEQDASNSIYDYARCGRGDFTFRSHIPDEQWTAGCDRRIRGGGHTTPASSRGNS